jgi:hypothetical protein
LGHSSLVVTQTFYASIDASDAGRRLSEIWGQKSTDSVPVQPKKEMLDTKSEKHILIKQKEFITGYV